MKKIQCAVTAAILALGCCVLHSARADNDIVQPGDRGTGQSENSLTIAENGKTVQPIVIAANASERTRETANYLAQKLEKLSGAKFEVTAGDGGQGIVLGTIQQFPIDALKKPLELRPASVGLRNGVEAYGIRTEARRVLLLGGGEPGVSHAASRFLHLLGYRRFYPSPVWEIAPLQKSLKFNRNETDRPAILARHIWYAFGIPSDPITMDTPPEKRAARSRADLGAWYRQNNLGESFRVFAAHNWASIISNNKVEFAAPPEYYSLIDGKRVPRSICVGNSAVRAMAVQNALNYFEKNPDADMFSMERGDGVASCECELCRALGSESNRVFGLANEVAREVRKKYPSKLIGVLAYNTHDVPPDFEMEPNIHVQVARLFIQSGNSFRDLVDMWSKKTKNLGVYDYFSTFQWGQDRLRAKASAGPTADIALLKSDIPYLAERGVLSLWSESSVAWGAHGRGNLVATRLMWNPQADVNAVLEDFYEKAFGPAAPAMKRYYERVDGENELFSNTLLGLAFRDVNEAAKLAENRSDVLARIAQIKEFLIFNYFNARVTAAATDEGKKPWFFEMLTHQFRTRYSYMTHWTGSSNYLGDYAKRYNEPTWILPNWKELAAAKKEGRVVSPPAWQKEPYTSDEIEARFQEGLKYFQPQTILPRLTFSDDLVPVQWPEQTPAPGARVVQLGRGRVWLYSRTGEALELEIQTGKNSRATTYSLLDGNGKTVGSGELPGEAGSHALKLEVPGSGMYIFESSGALNSSVPIGKVHTVSLLDNRGTRYSMQGFGGRNFFYVPKGIRQLQYYWNGGEHSLFDPTGKLVRKVVGTLDYVTVEIPQGMDGQCWSFNGRLDTREFINAPNYAAPSPNALLIPRELAEKDKLAIRK